MSEQNEQVSGYWPDRKHRIELLGKFKSTIILFLGIELVDQARFELGTVPVKIKSFFAKKKKVGRDIRFLNIGCNESPVSKEWINLDLFGGGKKIVSHDCRFPLPFSDVQFEGVFSEHFLEHLEYTHEARKLVREVYRILKSGGVFRVVVPDCGAYFNTYAKDGMKGVEKLRGTIDGKDPWFNVSCNTPMELLNIVIRQGVEHKFCYDEETLKLLLQSAGFKDIKAVPHDDGYRKDLLIDRQDRVSESLRIEGVK